MSIKTKSETRLCSNGKTVLRNTHGALHAVRVMILAQHILEHILEIPTKVKKKLNLKSANKLLSSLHPSSTPGNNNSRQPISFPEIIQWCALLHDSGRKGGGADYFDHLSGANAALYLNQECGLSPLAAVIAGRYAEHKDKPLKAKNDIRKLIADDDKEYLNLTKIPSFEKERKNFEKYFKGYHTEQINNFLKHDEKYGNLVEQAKYQLRQDNLGGTTLKNS